MSNTEKETKSFVDRNVSPFSLILNFLSSFVISQVDCQLIRYGFKQLMTF